MSELGPNIYPDNVFFEGKAVSWNGVSEGGNDARLGVIQDGFDETFSIPDSGERIWLHEPTGLQTLIIHVVEGDLVVDRHELKSAASVVHIKGGHEINVFTPEGQGPITYICDYPNTEPGLH